MLSRKDAVAMINDHLDEGIHTILPAKCGYEEGSKICWHYGRVELKVLLDAIYGGPPDPLNLDEHLRAYSQ